MQNNGPAVRRVKMTGEVITTLAIGVTVLVGVGMILATNVLAQAPFG